MKPTSLPVLLAAALSAGCDLPELREALRDAAVVDPPPPPPPETDASDPGTADAGEADAAEDDWTIPPDAVIGSCDPSLWTASASESHPVNPPAYAIDTLLPSRWSSGNQQTAGMTFDIDFGGFVLVDRVTIDHGFGQDGLGDFPRGIDVIASRDGARFYPTLKREAFTGSTGSVEIVFPQHAARYLRLQLSEGASPSWWTIHELRLGCSTPSSMGPDAGAGEPDAGSDMLPGEGVNPNRSAWVASAMPSAASDPPAAAVDGSPTTRWASGKTPQYGDEWFQVDMGDTFEIRQVWLTSNGTDYPSAFAIDVSTDGSTFTQVARGLGREITRVGFPAQPARYVRVRQIGSGHDHWWGINDITIIQ